MRKTNKQSTRLADDKKGVILITILFIVAVALIFITTSLMISISARQRVYTNAKSDQARLTVTSLAQSIWQAIYSQQLNDTELAGLANGNTLIRFNSSDIPGMNGYTDTDATAYFYTIAADLNGNPTKIGIECKCEIGGETQYYTLILKKNQGEGVPHPMFQMTVELGNPGMFNSFNVGVDAHRVERDNDDQPRRRQWEYRLPDGTFPDDNIMFLNGDATSNRDGSGFYGRVIITGHAYLRNAVFTDDVFFVGQNAVLDFEGTSSLNAPFDTYETNRGNAYFWGTNRPFATGQDQASHTMETFNNIYFDYRNIDATTSSVQLNTSSTGFNNADGYTIDGTPYLRGYNSTHPWSIGGNVYYEAGGGGAYLASAPSGWQSFGNNTDQVPNINRYLTVEDSMIDTVGEVTSPTGGYGTHSDHSDAIEITSATTSLTGGNFYYIGSSGLQLKKPITCDVSGGPITIYVLGNLSILNDSGTSAGFIINTPAGAENYVNFVLENNASVEVASRSTDNFSGFVDSRCFGGSTDYTYANIDQATIPRFFIFAGYTGGTAMTLGDNASNGGVVCTAFLGFFPSTTRGNNGSSLMLHNVNAGSGSHRGIVFYGRIACGSIPNSTDAGGNLNIPYCPSIQGQLNYRQEAYRDNTDYSVVADECGYFTA